jgi:cysteine desulfuration protein SufE
MLTFQQLIDDFAFLDNWEDRYRYVIELGQSLPELNEALKTDRNKIRGCASQVWLVSRCEDDAQTNRSQMLFEGDSDAHIVRGLISILFSIYNHRSAEEIVAINSTKILAGIGLDGHLSPQRSNGLAAMVSRIHSDAQLHLHPNNSGLA